MSSSPVPGPAIRRKWGAQQYLQRCDSSEGRSVSSAFGGYGLYWRRLTWWLYHFLFIVWFVVNWAQAVGIDEGVEVFQTFPAVEWCGLLGVYPESSTRGTFLCCFLRLNGDQKWSWSFSAQGEGASHQRQPWRRGGLAWISAYLPSCLWEVLFQALLNSCKSPLRIIANKTMVSLERISVRKDTKTVILVTQDFVG